MARLVYMHRFGGIYADLDFECLRSLENLLDHGGVTLAREPRGLGWYKRNRDFVSNALLFSPPGHSVWIEALELMVDLFRERKWYEPRLTYVLATSGPALVDRAIESHAGTDVNILPSHLFFPADVFEKSEASRRKLADEHGAYAVHHFANTWLSPAERALIRMGHWSRMLYRRLAD
jgi:mannosyltransferase OCH1-like enzyme